MNQNPHDSHTSVTAYLAKSLKVTENGTTRKLVYEFLFAFRSSCTTSDPVSTRMGDRLWTGKPFRYVTSQLGQLSLSSLRGR